jgi:hypothetical protein
VESKVRCHKRCVKKMDEASGVRSFLTSRSFPQSHCDIRHSRSPMSFAKFAIMLNVEEFFRFVQLKSEFQTAWKQLHNLRKRELARLKLLHLSRDGRPSHPTKAVWEMAYLMQLRLHLETEMDSQDM